MTNIIFTGPKDSPFLVALAHGAGTHMDTHFMKFFAEGLARHGTRVARFEFPYMLEQRKSGKKRPPNTVKLLLYSWHQVITELGAIQFDNLAVTLTPDGQSSPSLSGQFESDKMVLSLDQKIGERSETLNFKIKLQKEEKKSHCK